MRVLAEMGLLLVLGLALAWLVGLRSDGVFIAGLLLAVSVAGLVEWLRPAQWSWVLCTAYLVIAVAVPSWCAFMPLIAYDTARLPALASTGARAGARTAASGRSPQCLADRGLSPFPCRCNTFDPVAFGRRALDMGVAADRALVRP